jgi:hypothetical protein
MKKVLLLFMTLLASMATHAYDAQIDGIYYNLNNSSKTATVTGLTGGSSGNSNAYSGEVEIPESVTYGNTTYHVTAIGDYAFKDCTALTGIIIPSTVTSFGEYTFFGCTGLKYVIALIENPFEIPQYTFYYNSQSEGIKPLSHQLFVLGNTWSGKWDNWGSSPKSNGSVFSADVDGIETKFEVISVGDRTCKLQDGFGDIPKNTSGVYTIPERTCGLTVTGIGYGAFMDCNQLTGIIIPNTVTDIDVIPFMNCTCLTSITIPSSVKNIKGDTFKLTNITEVKVDEANKVYDSRDKCNAIIETSTNTLVAGCRASTIPNSVTAIADLAFEGTGIAAIDIPEQVTSIGASAFRYCDNLVSVTVRMVSPVNITEDVFTNRTNATLYVPYGSKAAYSAANYWNEFKQIVEFSPIITFADANVKAICVANWDTDKDGGLSEAEAAAVERLGKVFKENKSITSFEELRYFTGLTYIDDESFMNCTNLTHIVLPNNIGSIGFNAFFQCRSLISLVIPSSVAIIRTTAFLDCMGLTSIEVESGNTNYDSRENCNAIIETATNKLILGCNNTVIPASVTGIGSSAFSHCLTMTSIEIPEGVTSIESYAFYNCAALTAIVIPDKVEFIGEDAFWHCDELASVSIGKRVTSIGNTAFQSCNNLTSVTVRMTSPISITENVFTNRANATLHIPYGCKAAYEDADYWKDFKEIKEMDPICSTPTIHYVEGKLHFDCETDGVEYHYEIAKLGSGNDVSLIGSTTYQVSVYATKAGYENSETATVELTIKNGDMNGDGVITVTDTILLLDEVLTKP